MKPDPRCVGLSGLFGKDGELCHVTNCNCWKTISFPESLRMNSVYGKYANEKREPMKTLITSDLMGGILFDIQKERERQEELVRKGKFSWTCAANRHIANNSVKLAVLAEEFGEVAKEVTEGIILDGRGLTVGTKADVVKANIRKELIQVAAVCVAWCEALDVELDDREEFKSEYPSVTANLAQRESARNVLERTSYICPTCKTHVSSVTHTEHCAEGEK